MAILFLNFRPSFNASDYYCPVPRMAPSQEPYGYMLSAACTMGFYGSVIRGGSAAGSIVGGWPPGVFSGRYGAVSNYVEWLFSRMKVFRPETAKQREPLPQGTDSPWYLERGRSYIREKLVLGNKLPDISRVERNLYGEAPKDEAQKAQYDGWIDADKKNDAVLRMITENIAGDWANNAKARGAFERKWSRAVSEDDRVAMVRALLDPKGDNSYLQTISQVIPGLSANERDEERLWEKITEWLSDNVGIETIYAMGDEMRKVPSSNGIAGETPMSDSEKYVGKLVEKGYLRDEALDVLKRIRTEEAADNLVRNLNEQRNTPNIKEAMERISDLGNKSSSASNNQERKQYQAQLDDYRRQLAALQAQRAEQFLQDYMRYSRWHDGKRRTEQLGYKAGEMPAIVRDVPTAVRWLNGETIEPIVEEKKEDAKEEVKSKINGQAGNSKGKAAKNTHAANKGGGQHQPVGSETASGVTAGINKQYVLSEMKKYLESVDKQQSGKFTKELLIDDKKYRISYTLDGQNPAANPNLKVAVENNGSWVDITEWILEP